MTEDYEKDTIPVDPAEWLASLGESPSSIRGPEGRTNSSGHREIDPQLEELEPEIEAALASMRVLDGEFAVGLAASWKVTAIGIDEIRKFVAAAEDLNVRTIYSDRRTFADLQTQAVTGLSPEVLRYLESITLSFHAGGVVHQVAIYHPQSPDAIRTPQDEWSPDYEELEQLAIGILGNDAFPLERRWDLEAEIDRTVKAIGPDLHPHAAAWVVGRVIDLANEPETRSRLLADADATAQRRFSELEQNPDFAPLEWHARAQILAAVDFGRTRRALDSRLRDVAEKYRVPWEPQNLDDHPNIGLARSLARVDAFHEVGEDEAQVDLAKATYADLPRWQLSNLVNLTARVFAAEVVPEAKEDMANTIAEVIRTAPYERAAFKRTLRARDEVVEAALEGEPQWKKGIAAEAARERFEFERRSAVERKYGDFSRLAIGGGATRTSVARFLGISTGVLTRLEDQSADLDPIPEAIEMYEGFISAQ